MRPMTPVRRTGARRVPPPPVTREQLPPLLLRQAGAHAGRARATSPTSTSSNGRRCRRVARRVHRLGQLRALARTRRRRHRVHGRRRVTRARGSPPCCSSTSPPSPSRTASSASRPRCSPRTGRCSPCSPAPAGRCSARSTAGSSRSTSRSPTTAEYLDSIAEREQRADSRAMARLLLPRSIAVVGAIGPTRHGRWRAVAQHHAHATVPVYAVNPNRTPIDRRRARA